MEANTNSRKQSVLLGGLISTAGIFISKFLGLIYVVPFDAILQYISIILSKIGLR